MNLAFSIGDILYFKTYCFTDKGTNAPHFGLVLLGDGLTKFKNSILCCVITSKEPNVKKWCLILKCDSYKCFKVDSYACFDRKDLQSVGDLDRGRQQPQGHLNRGDLKRAFKILKNSLFNINDWASKPFLKGAIIREWKKALGSTGIR